MHFLCSPFGSAGDVFPSIGLALALKSCGHRVTFLASEYFESDARKVGLTFEPFGTEDQFLALANDPRLFDPMKAMPAIMESGVIPHMRAHYEVCARHFQEDPATVIVTNMLGIAARVAQDKLGVPVITLQLQPSVMWSDHDPPRLPVVFGPVWLQKMMYRIGMRFVINPSILPALNQFRRELDLEPVRHLLDWWNSPDGVACLFPDWFGPVQPDWPQPLIQTDFPLWDIPDGRTLTRDVTDFLEAGDPPLVFTPGSANVFGERFFHAASDACGRLGRRGMLMTRFPKQLPNVLPDGVAHFEYAPFSELLPRTLGLVHHGGVGSMSQAMAAGVPQVIVPLAHDQFDNAQRVWRLKLGASVSHRRLTGRKLASAIRAQIESQQVTSNCRNIAGRLAKRDGLQRMADLIVQQHSTGDFATA